MEVDLFTGDHDRRVAPGLGSKVGVPKDPLGQGHTETVSKNPCDGLIVTVTTNPGIGRYPSVAVPLDVLVVVLPTQRLTDTAKRHAGAGRGIPLLKELVRDWGIEVQANYGRVRLGHRHCLIATQCEIRQSVVAGPPAHRMPGV